MTADVSPVYVYRLFDSEDRLLYVGCTSDIAKRLGEHKRDKAWSAEIETYSVEGPYPRLNGYAREQAVIRCSHPLHNVTHNPMSPVRRVHLAAQLVATRLGSPVAPIEFAMRCGDLPPLAAVPDDILTAWVWKRYGGSSQARWVVAYRAEHPRPVPLERLPA